MFKGVENEVNAIPSEKSEFYNQKFNILKFFKTYENLFLNNYFRSEKKKNNIRFLINKRGRRRKSLITNNEINKDEITNLGKKVHNKYCNDNIKRRLKACYHKYIISFLNNLMKTVLKQTRIRFVKMNSKITKDIGIEYNRILLNKKIKDIIVDISDKYVDHNNNQNCVKLIEAQKENEEIIKILNMTYKDFYINYYLKSTKNNTKENSYEEHKEIILRKVDEKYLKKFCENAENLIDFFTSGKNRKSKKPLFVKSVNIPLENDTLESSNTNEMTNSDEIENFYIKRNLVSTCVQTELYDINAKILLFG